MAVLAPPVQVVTSGAPPFVQVPSGAPPFVAVTGNAPPITIVASGAPPITLFNADGSIWSAYTPVGGGALLEGEADGFATDFLYATDASRVALKTGGSTVAYTVDAFYQNAGTSPKMVYDVAGVLGWSPHNLLTRSSEFDNGAWTFGGMTIGANAVAAPNGNAEADAFIPASGSVDVYAYQATATVIGPTYTFSVYAKNGTLGNNWLQLDLNSGTIFSAWFNLATGAKGASVASPTSYTITSVGNGWYRCDITALAGATTSYCTVRSRSADGSTGNITGNGTSPSCYLWGAQFNRGPTALAYLPTTTAARVGLALDYDPVTHAAKGLLCEPQATNLFTRSNDLSFMIAELGTVTTDTQTGPDGLLTADTFTENTATGAHNCYESQGYTANADYTTSRFYKMGTRRYATIGWSDGTNGAYAVYDLQSGVVGSSAAIGAGIVNSASMQAVGNGWYRCILSARSSGTVIYSTFATANAATITPDSVGRQSFLGTGATLFMGHRQVEAGTVATSPIPTIAATVTRAADIVKITSAQINFSATAGNWWADIDMKATGPNRVICYDRLGGISPLNLWDNTTRRYSLYDTVDHVAVVVPNDLGAHKIASAVAASDRAFAADGLTPAIGVSAGSALLVDPVTIGVGCDPAGATQMNGYIRKLRYLPRRPSNAELQTMTATVPYAGTIVSQVMVTAAAASTGASASFTPPANSTLVAFVSARGGSSATATSLTDSLGSIWVKIGDYLGPPATAFVVTGVYTLAIGPSPVAMTVTGGSTVTGVSLGSGCQVISCTGSIGPLSNVQSGQSGAGSVSLTVSGVSVLTYYVRQTTASTIVIPTGYTELGGGAHIQYNNMTASVAYDLTSPGNQNWTGGSNAIAWAGEISG